MPSDRSCPWCISVLFKLLNEFIHVGFGNRAVRNSWAITFMCNNRLLTRTLEDPYYQRGSSRIHTISEDPRWFLPSARILAKMGIVSLYIIILISCTKNTLNEATMHKDSVSGSTMYELQVRRDRCTSSMIQGYPFSLSTVACSRGTYFEKKSRMCQVCPPGTYQDEEAGVGSCKQCPKVDDSSPSLASEYLQRNHDGLVVETLWLFTGWPGATSPLECSGTKQNDIVQTRLERINWTKLTIVLWKVIPLTESSK